MKKILIVGANGMLGKDMVDGFSHAGYEVVGVDREELDITKTDLVQSKLTEIAPDVVINCAAYTDVNGAEDAKELAYQINAYGPEYLAGATRELDIPLVQISTNYVFDGTKETPYAEDDQPEQPLNVYGASKLRGEQLVKDTNPKHYIVRISNLFGPHGKNFVQTMVSLAKDRDTLQVVDDQLGNPTYTKDLVQAVRELLEDEAEYGIYHLTNTTPTEAGISWYRLAKRAIEYKGLPTKVLPVSSDQFPTKAERPIQGTLLNSKRPKLRSYQEALQEYVNTYLKV